MRKFAMMALVGGLTVMMMAVPAAATAPQYRVLVSAGVDGGSTSAQTADTNLSWSAPGWMWQLYPTYAQDLEDARRGTVGFMINIQEVPGLTVTWSHNGGTNGSVFGTILDYNSNPKERVARAGFKFTATGTYTVTCSLTYTSGSGSATTDIDFTVTVDP